MMYVVTLLRSPLLVRFPLYTTCCPPCCPLCCRLCCSFTPLLFLPTLLPRFSPFPSLRSPPWQLSDGGRSGLRRHRPYKLPSLLPPVNVSFAFSPSPALPPRTGSVSGGGRAGLRRHRSHHHASPAALLPSTHIPFHPSPRLSTLPQPSLPALAVCLPSLPALAVCLVGGARDLDATGPTIAHPLAALAAALNPHPLPSLSTPFHPSPALPPRPSSVSALPSLLGSVSGGGRAGLGRHRPHHHTPPAAFPAALNPHPLPSLSTPFHPSPALPPRPSSVSGGGRAGLRRHRPHHHTPPAALPAAIRPLHPCTVG
ncbi:unnamed protein product [Closterium sp. NIES-64]|nr:unnamed protein product [Closterium sp. NIES-64]